MAFDRSPRPPHRRPGPPYAQRPSSRMRSDGPAPEGSESWSTPWVQMKYFTYHPCVFPRFIGRISPDAKAGDLVAVYDKEGKRFGTGFFNPTARVPLRIMHHGEEAVDEAWFHGALDRAMDLRLTQVDLNPETTDAYRVIHSDGDGISGLVVDRYADVLSVEVTTLGVYRRIRDWLPILHKRLGTRREVVHVDPHVAKIEGIRAQDLPPPPTVRSVKIKEHGIRYAVDFEEGHKTGFFCDQRENRLKLSKLVHGKRMLDLCCYTGGFSLAAKVLGGAEDVTAVDLDEKAIAQARHNANLNNARIKLVHSDAFTWARQMQQNGERWDVVMLDPPKLVESRDGEDDGGRRKYEDLNALALTLVQPNGLFITCSCSGLLSEEEFERTLIRVAHRQNKRLQFLDRTGPGMDHPVMSNCPESRYLKVYWTRVVV